MIRLHVTDDGLSVRLLGVEVAAIHDERTTEPRRTVPRAANTIGTVTRAPRVLAAALRFVKDTTK